MQSIEIGFGKSDSLPLKDVLTHACRLLDIDVNKDEDKIYILKIMINDRDRYEDRYRCLSSYSKSSFQLS